LLDTGALLLKEKEKEKNEEAKVAIASQQLVPTE
jgi:hypothetical protein